MGKTSWARFYETVTRIREKVCTHSIVHDIVYSIVHGVVHVTRLIENEAGYAHQSALQISVCVRQPSVEVHDIELSGKFLPGARSFFSLRRAVQSFF